MKKYLLIGLLSSVAIAVGPAAEASLIRYEYFGLVLQSELSPVPVGAQISGSFTYDPDTVDSTADASDASGDKMLYRWNPPNSPIGLTITFGAKTVTTTGIDLIEVQDNPPGTPDFADSFSMRTEFSDVNIAVQFGDLTSAVFSDTSLPTILNLADFSSPNHTTFGYQDPTFDNNGVGFGLGRQFSGTITELRLADATVPEPTTLLLLGLGLAGLGFARLRV